MIGTAPGKEGTEEVANGQTSGIEEASNEGAFSVYPNPSEGQVTVSWTGEVSEVLVFSANGQLVQRMDTNSQEVKVEGLSTGMYTVIGLGQGVKFSKKLTVL